MDAGNITEVHDELCRSTSKSNLHFTFFHHWAEILSSTNLAPLAMATSASKRIKLKPEENLILDSYAAVDHWVRQDLQGLNELIVRNLKTVKKSPSIKDAINAENHLKICVRLLRHRLEHPNEYEGKSDGILVAIGDSHSLIPAGRIIQWNGRGVRVQAMPVRGIKMFHLGSGTPAKYRSYMKLRLKQVPQDSDVLLSVGEIDCRPNEGIFHAARKAPKVPIGEVLSNTVSAFMLFMAQAFRDAEIESRRITLLGVPNPRYDVLARLPAGATETEFREFITLVNETIKREAHALGWAFLDSHAATSDSNAATGEDYWLDEIHFSPTFYNFADNLRISATAAPQASTATISRLHEDAGDACRAKSVLRFEGHCKSFQGTVKCFRLPEWQTLLPSEGYSFEKGSLRANGNPLKDDSVDAILSLQHITQIFAHDVPYMLSEFRRVLKADGFLILSCDDLQAIGELLVEDRLLEPIIASEKFTALDLLYGDRAKLSSGDPAAARRCGMTWKVLAGTLKAVGFHKMAGKRRASAFDMWVIASKGDVSDDNLRKLALKYFPD